MSTQYVNVRLSHAQLEAVLTALWDVTERADEGLRFYGGDLRAAGSAHRAQQRLESAYKEVVAHRALEARARRNKAALDAS